MINEIGRLRSPGLPVAAMRVCWALLAATLTATIAVPASAAPPGVPDPGVRPALAGPLALPVATATAPTSTALPPAAPLPGSALAVQLNAKQIEYAATAETLLRLEQERSSVRRDRELAESNLRLAQQAARDARAIAAAAAHDAFRHAAAWLPEQLRPPLYELDQLSRLQRGADESMNAAARQLAWAGENERLDDVAYRQAVRREQDTSRRYQSTQATYRQQEVSLTRLRQQNAPALAAIEQQIETREASLAPKGPAAGTVAGAAAHPDALAAVRFAMSQRGKPYVWAAEGPDSYDCSGLMWAAYRTVGRTLPRVSRDQFYGTRQRPVARDALLPGDLVFYNRSGNWQDIYHVGMYIGDGKMVYAPTFGDVVKIGSVRWSSYFAATRVIGEVAAPTRPPAVRPPTSQPSPRPTPSTRPTPSRPTSSSPPATPPPTPSGTSAPPTSSASVSPSSSASASASPSTSSSSTQSNGTPSIDAGRLRVPGTS